ncbi:Uncharacterised protein [Shewanella baltica]|nr:Uncharacterised protein [Shewanella baltica]
METIDLNSLCYRRVNVTQSLKKTTKIKATNANFAD